MSKELTDDSGRDSPSGSADCSSSSDEEIDLDDDKSAADKVMSELLDFTSAKFSPLLALRCTDLAPPVPNARRFLNLEHYSRAVTSPSKRPSEDLFLKPVKLGVKNRLQAIASSSSAQKSEMDKPGTSTSESVKYPMTGRKFLAHQMPVFVPRKEHQNTLKFMKNVEGPLGVLSKAMHEKKRLKIWTRNATGIRGYCIGVVEAFDKHWNIGLRDVDEKFVRKRQPKFSDVPEIAPKSENLTDDEKQHDIECSQIKYKNKSLRTYSAIKSFKSNRNKRVPEPCSGKKTPQLLVSSDNVMGLLREMSNLNIKSGNDVENSQRQVRPSKSQLRKKGLTVFKSPYVDANGFLIVANSQKFEIVERHVGQLFMMGNDIVLIETEF